MATVKEVMSTSLHYVSPTTTVGEAVALMAQHRIGSTLVMEGTRLVGIFTERDTVRALSHTHNAPAHEVSSWMTPDPLIVTPEDSVDSPLQTLLHHNSPPLPLMDRGAALGILPIT